MSPSFCGMPPPWCFNTAMEKQLIKKEHPLTSGCVPSFLLLNSMVFGLFDTCCFSALWFVFCLFFFFSVFYFELFPSLDSCWCDQLQSFVAAFISVCTFLLSVPHRKLLWVPHIGSAGCSHRAGCRMLCPPLSFLARPCTASSWNLPMASPAVSFLRSFLGALGILGRNHYFFLLVVNPSFSSSLQ